MTDRPAHWQVERGPDGRYRMIVRDAAGKVIHETGWHDTATRAGAAARRETENTQ